MQDGFLGYRASLMLDFVVCALAALVPLLLVSIRLAKSGRYLAHRTMQWGLAMTLLVAVAAFEIDVQLVHGGWEQIVNRPDMPERRTGAELTAIRQMLWVHLVFAISTPLLWIATLVLAGRGFSTPPMPGKHSSVHKKLGWLAALDLVATSVTGWVFYYMAFMR